MLWVGLVLSRSGCGSCSGCSTGCYSPIGGAACGFAAASAVAELVAHGGHDGDMYLFLGMCEVWQQLALPAATACQ